MWLADSFELWDMALLQLQKQANMIQQVVQQIIKKQCIASWITRSLHNLRQ